MRCPLLFPQTMNKNFIDLNKEIIKLKFQQKTSKSSIHKDRPQTKSKPDVDDIFNDECKGIETKYSGF